jgi:hypothetical protein
MLSKAAKSLVMKIKYILPLCISVLFISSVAESQIIMGRRPPRYGMRPPRSKNQQKQAPKFEPSVNLSVGYGFPNGDKNSIPEYDNAYSSGVSQTGPFTGAIDYRFSRSMSIGVLATHGMVKAPYYSYGNTTGVPDFNFKEDNWAIMLDFLHYIPATKSITTYTRIAVGFNIWTQEYTDALGSKINMAPADLPDLAYQLSLGAQIKMSKNAGFFLEAGYGKYIVNGGLTFKF